MTRRLYVVLPDLAAAIRVAHALLDAGIGYRDMHFLGRRGMSLGGLHEAGAFQKTDLRHALLVGAGIGLVGGMVLGLYLNLAPIAGARFGIGTFVLCALGGAAFGAWSSTLVGASAPNTKLKPYERDIEAGRILLMVDVPVAKLEEIEQHIRALLPGAAIRS